MTTVINTPPSGENSSSGVAIVIGVIVAIILITLFFIYVLPDIRGNTNPESDSVNINVDLPTSEPAPVSPNTPTY